MGLMRNGEVLVLRLMVIGMEYDLYQKEQKGVDVGCGQMVCDNYLGFPGDWKLHITPWTLTKSPSCPNNDCSVFCDST